MSHRISLIKNHELELWHISPIRIPCNFALRELLDLFSDDLDATFVTSIEFEDPLPVEVSSEKVFSQGQHS